MSLKLVMYLGDEVIDTIPLSLGKIQISNIIKDLKQVHKTAINKSALEPAFCLENVQSRINTFTSIKMDHVHS